MRFCNDKTLSDLEWPRLLEAVAARCQGDPGRRAARVLPFAASRADVETSLAEVREARRALDAGEPVPLYGLRDVEAAIARLKMGATLAPTELREIAATLASARVLRRFLSSQRSAMPALAAACLTDASLDEVEDVVSDAFDIDGLLADHASPRLRELRIEYRNARARLVGRLEELMRKYEHVLQDQFWTEREGRYVLPVRTDAHERFPGIVHTTSGSGATLFVEPRAIIPLGNRLKMLEGEVRREEEAIYERLSGLLADRVASVAFAYEALTHADVRAAVGRMAVDLGLVFVTLDDAATLDLHAAKHPLLALDGIDVVPSDVKARSAGAVVISGPNAGGKTVALKTVGLCALMLRAGMPLPCAEGSTMGVFDAVLTDVGDDQSLQRNLSTFSAHVKNLAGILDEAGPGALVLLDEVATGTDPREGEALAAAVLDGLCARGAAVICTTHYEGLKTIALADSRFTNASVGFELATMSPTFQIVWGIPGGSSALAVARRFGIPSLVLERAERFLSREHTDFEKLVEGMHAERRSLELARAAAESATREADDRARRLDAELARVRAGEAGALDKEVEALRVAVRRARDDLRAAQASIRSKKLDERAMREVTRVVDQVAAKVAVGGEFDRDVQPFALPVMPDELRRGARVYVPRLRAEAEVTEVLGGGQLRVAAGPLKLTVSADDVRLARPEPPPPRRTEKPGSRPRIPVAHTSIARAPIAQTRDNSVDLRGLRLEDAIGMAEQFVDRLIGAGQGVGYFIHGHGTGALRDGVREMLQANRAVESFRPGEKVDGGEGVTVAVLKD